MVASGTEFGMKMQFLFKDELLTRKQSLHRQCDDECTDKSFIRCRIENGPENGCCPELPGQKPIQLGHDASREPEWRAVSETHPVRNSGVEQQACRSHIVVGQNRPP